MKYHATDELDIERAQAEGAPGGLTGDRKCLRQQILERFSLTDALPELICLVGEIAVAEAFQALFEGGYRPDGFCHLPQKALIAAAEQASKNVGHRGLPDELVRGRPGGMAGGQRRVFYGLTGNLHLGSAINRLFI